MQSAALMDCVTASGNSPFHNHPIQRSSQAACQIIVPGFMTNRRNPRACHIPSKRLTDTNVFWPFSEFGETEWSHPPMGPSIEGSLQPGNRGRTVPPHAAGLG